MENLKKLIKNLFDLWVRKRWLKEIDRSVNRYNKAKTKTAHEHYVMSALIKEYNKLYSDAIWSDRDGKYAETD